MIDVFLKNDLMKMIQLKYIINRSDKRFNHLHLDLHYPVD